MKMFLEIIPLNDSMGRNKGTVHQHFFLFVKIARRFDVKWEHAD
jgi:hypothetical protein